MTETAPQSGKPDAGEEAKNRLLLAATFILAVCGLVYELIAGTVSSYLLGDSIYHFSLVIGLFMSAMGLGAWLSRYVKRPERAFVSAQISLAVAGGFSALILFTAFALIENYSAFLFLLCIITGALIGLEIPLVIRILEGRGALSETLSNVLTVDYIGALAAALLFPLVVVPHLGLLGAGFVFGGLNLLVAALAWWVFRDHRSKANLFAILIAGGAILLSALNATSLQNTLERRLYAQEIIYAEDSEYQRIVITRNKQRYQLFLNGSIQFDTLDEHRYHETLVHPVMVRAPRIKDVLILGGGDGMATREVLRYPEVERVTLVDLDPAVTTLFKGHEALSPLNGEALNDPRVTIVNQDAWKYLEETGRIFDVAILDLPDPKDVGVAKLYTRSFYAALTARMSAGGMIVTQATSPVYARKAFSTILATLASSPAPARLETELTARPYHSYVPSFGDWGFILAGGGHLDTLRRSAPEQLKYYTPETDAALWQFSPDTAPLDLDTNTLIRQTLPELYEAGWAEWFD